MVRYNVHRGTSAGFTPVGGNRIAQPSTPGYVDTTAPGSYFYKVTAEDAAGNIGAVSNEAAATVTRRHDRAERADGAHRAGDRQHRQPQLDRLHATTSASSATTSTAAPPPASPPAPATGSRNRPGTSYADTGLAPAATSTRSPPRTRPATSAPPRTRPPPPSPTPPRPAPPAPSPPPSPAARQPQLGRRHRQRRRQPLQPPPRHHQRLHPQHRQPDRATDRAQLQPTPASPPAPTSTSSPPKTPPATSARVSNTATATVADTTPPSTPTLTATGGAGQATLSWTAATDNVAVTRYNLHRSTTSGFTPSTANRIAQPTGTSYTDTGLAAGTYYYKLTAEDAAGNLSAASNQATATVTAPPVTGLVAAYGLDAGTGTTITDQSGTGNNGTLTNTTWAGASAGKYGNALTFNGTNATVTIPDSDSLDLTTGMTLEAWVRPTDARHELAHRAS